MRGTLALVCCLLGCADVFDIERVTAGADPSDASVSGRCPASFGDERYLVVTDPLLDWIAAEEHCRALDVIADDDIFVHLAVITTVTESTSVPLPLGVRAWIGLADVTAPEPPPFAYVWITDELPADIPWAPSEPDSSSSAPVGELRQGAGGVFDSTSRAIQAFVCECDSWPVVESKFR